MSFYIRSILLVTVLISTSIACSIPLRGMTLAKTESPVISDLPQNLEEFIDENGQINPETGTITVTLTQEELTAYLNSYLASQSDISFKDPQIILSKDRMDVYGNLQESILSANIKISLNALVNEAGQIDINIVEADFGPIPIPENMLNTILSQVKESLIDTIASVNNGSEITQIVINDGSMSITGSYQ
jgi:uncharacterized protein YpmS